ncbi:MAG: TlpA disulfide reductase family protein, partial [Melioribacteraceae bacterium]
QPMKRADIVWVGNPEKFPREVIQKFNVSPDGTFEFDTRRRGLHRIWFTGIEHKSYMIPFYLDKPDTTIVEVHLSKLEIPENLNKIILFADFDPVKNKSRIKDTIEISKDGIFRKTYKAYGDKFIYELNDEKREYQLAGTQLDSHSFECTTRFEERFNYYYSSVINTISNTEVKFEYGPKLFKAESTKPYYCFIKADTLTKKFLIVHEDNLKRKEKYNEYIKAGKKKGIYNNEYANAYLYDKDMEELDKLIETEPDAFMKNAWIVSRMDFAVIDAFFKTGVTNVSKEQAQWLLNNTTPDSPLWSYVPNGLMVALAFANKKEKEVKEFSTGGLEISTDADPYVNYLEEAYYTHPDSSIKSRMLVRLISFHEDGGKKDKVLEYMDKYRAFYPEEYKNHVMRDNYDSKRSIQLKKKIPQFSFASIKDSTRIKTNESLLGKKYLIHFWGSWCAPCKIEMQAIQNINRMFGGKNFEIISVAVDFSKERVFDFQTKMPMPWFNSFLDQRNDTNGVMRSFEISTIPKNILVDEKGTIVAVNDLDKILEILSKK